MTLPPLPPAAPVPAGQTIAHSLRGILLAVVVTLALLLSLTFFLLEYVSYRQHLSGTYRILAATLGINLEPHLLQLEAAEARNILATTEHEREIEGIFLFDRFDRPLAYYKHPQAFALKPQPELVLSREQIVAALATNREVLRFHRAHLTIFSPIYQNDTKLGTLYLVVSLRAFYLRIGLWLFAALTIASLAIPLGFFLAARLTRRIIRPVEQLAQQMAAISASQDFSVRAAEPEFAELRTLAGSFNAMLGQIETRDRSLAAINANLETMVLQATQDLRESEIKYRALFENSPVSLWEADFSALRRRVLQLKEDGISDFHGYFRDFPEQVAATLALVVIDKVNRRTQELFALPDTLPPQRSLPILHADALLPATCLALAEGRSAYRGEGRGCTADGRELFLSLNWAVLPDHADDCSQVVIAIKDLTASKEIELALLASLREKESLIREVHHRVKNNLQIITSLVRLQLKRFHDPAVVAELQTMLNRIRSIALVHEKLYHEARQITDLSGFVNDLAQELRRIYLGDQPIEIGIRIEKTDNPLPFDLVTSLVMILNELLTNTFKHAFRHRPGRVEIALRQEGDGLLLCVADDGCGLPAAPRAAGALGLTLVESLAAQADGAVSFAGPPGTVVTVRCPLAAAAR